MKESFRCRDDWPRTGWYLEETVDNEAADFKCENCGYPHVRFEHHLINKNNHQKVRVGCVCAEHLTQDFTTPRLRERNLKSRAARRLRWPTLNWRVSGKGNLFLRKDGRIVVIRQNYSGTWSASYCLVNGQTWIKVRGFFHDPVAAKLAAFDAIYSRQTSAE